MDPASVGALTFDVFGTVVDWRSSITREGEAFGTARGLDVDWAKFADAWRGLYQPAMEEVRSGRRPWVKLDDLHRESLVRLLAEFKITDVSPAEVDQFNHAWHRLDPWPDAVAGLTRALARDLGPKSIRVNAIVPGWIMTERQITLWLTPEGEQELLRRQCLKRRLVPEDIARVVLFLAADDSSACTNQSYVVDGGWV